MALSANTVWEVRTTGADTNGGGFVTGASGTDFSQQNAAQFALTTVTTSAANAICLSASAAATMVGNICQIISGTNFLVGFYQILSVSVGVSFTLDRTCTSGAGANGVINIGGAILSPALVAANKTAGNGIWVKAGTYSLTSASTNIAGGCISDGVGASTAVMFWEGYSATRGDLGTPPVFQASGIATATLFSVPSNSAGLNINNITFDGNNLTAINAFNSARRVLVFKCNFINCKASGAVTTVSSVFLECTATNITGGTAAINAASVGGVAIGCETYANTVSGIAAQFIDNCISYNNTGASSDGFICSNEGSIQNCVAYANGRDGFRVAAESVYFVNCIAEGNTGNGFNAATNPTLNGALINCAAYNNSSSVGSNLTCRSLNFVTGLSSFFVNAAGSNFALNNTASAGASARVAGYPGVYPTGNSTGYLDIGAVQHQDTPSTIYVETMNTQIGDRSGVAGY